MIRVLRGKHSFTIDEPAAVGGVFNRGGVKCSEVTDDIKSCRAGKNGTAVLYSVDTIQQASNLANAIAANSAFKWKDMKWKLPVTVSPNPVPPVKKPWLL